MSRLDYETTVGAAAEILRRGRQPSATAVVQHLGYGSKSTAVKHLNRWREELDRGGFVLPPVIPESLAKHVEAFWSAAYELATRELDEERATLRDEKVQLDKALGAALEDLERVRKQAEELGNSAADYREQVEQTAKLADERALTIEQLREELKANEERASRTLSDITAKAERDLERRTFAWEKETAELKAVIETRDRELARERQRYESDTGQWMCEVSALRDETRALNEKLREESSKREQAVLAGEKARASLQRDRAELQNTVWQKDQEIDQLREQLASQAAQHERDVERLQEQVGRQDGELARLRNENERLQDLLQQALSSGGA